MIKKYHNLGFSLVEIMVVTSVITVGFVAVLSLIRKAIMVYYNNQNYLAAATISQQGLEITRYIRDDNWIVGVPAFTNISSENPQENDKTIFAIDQQSMVDPSDAGRQKIIRFYNSAITADNGNLLPSLPPAGVANGDLSGYTKDSRAKIYFDTDATAGHNFYTASSTLTAITDRYEPTIFNNLIQTTYHDNGTPANKADDYLYVISMVYWQDRGVDKYFTLATYLYDYSWKYCRQSCTNSSGIPKPPGAPDGCGKTCP